ncbi:MAG: LptA/OstA family protein, partial [Acidobacteriota bacterium]
GTPAVWDSKARAKAPEIDWDTKNQTSELRGGASTTYYSQGKTGGATPFGGTDKPVYVTSQTAKFDHKGKVAVFSGNARSWQENNYVRGEQLTIIEPEGKFIAESNVQSLLYEAKRKENGVETNQPIFVAARKLTYTRNSRLLRYEDSVDIRQGKDRITGGIANIVLTETNEPQSTEIENNVVIVQPERRTVAEYVRYEKGSDTVLLRGNPATVEDAVRGTSRGSQMTINLRENTVASEGPSKQNPSGRVRSVYKVKNQ